MQKENELTTEEILKNLNKSIEENNEALDKLAEVLNIDRQNGLTTEKILENLNESIEENNRVMDELKEVLNKQA